MNERFLDKVGLGWGFHNELIENIKIFWGENSDIVGTIYALIDDIWGGDYGHSHYVFGEVMSIFLTNNSSNGLLSVTRGDYIEGIMSGGFVRKILGIPSHEHVKKHQKLLIGMKVRKVTQKAVLTKRNSKGLYSRTVIFRLRSVYYNRIYFGISNTPYKIIDVNGVGYCINSYRNYTLVHHCNKYMVKKEMDYSGCDRANNVAYIVRRDVFIRNERYLNEELRKELSKIGCEDYNEYVKKLSFDTNYIKNVENSSKIRMIQACLNIKLDVLFYLPNFIDNRGRQYIMGIISPTFNKYFRKIINICSYDEPQYSIKMSRFYENIIKCKKHVEIYNLGDEESYYLIILLIELSKDEIKGTDKKYLFSIDDFITRGLEIYKAQKDELMNNYLIYTIDNLINKNYINKNYIIYKDATASGLQNFGIIAGYKKNMLKYLNLEGIEWCDTYQYLVNLHVEDENFRKRDYWKRTIMTIPYNSTLFKCFEYFKESLIENNVKFNENEIFDLHKKFYDKIKNNLKNYLYDNDDYRNKMINFRYLEPYSITQTEYKVQYLGERDKYIYKNIIYVEDEKSSNTALEANNLHYLDSLLVKHLLNKYKIITIHDCYGIPLSRLHEVMDDVNIYYAKYIEHEYSLFILK